MSFADTSHPQPTPAVRALSIDGRRFEITLYEETARSWHWIIAAPGDLALSGQASSETQALDSACLAGRALAQRETA